mmetsp:Transcript_36062/g.70894  ORF Transcript_36062/g.70894 Transcript_36062/m.70894 type:complete len:223 (-) Transcript_36062:266-934(-)
MAAATDSLLGFVADDLACSFAILSLSVLSFEVVELDLVPEDVFLGSSCLDLVSVFSAAIAKANRFLVVVLLTTVVKAVELVLLVARDRDADDLVGEVSLLMASILATGSSAFLAGEPVTAAAHPSREALGLKVDDADALLAGAVEGFGEEALLDVTFDILALGLLITFEAEVALAVFVDELRGEDTTFFLSAVAVTCGFFAGSEVSGFRAEPLDDLFSLDFS